MTHKIVAVSQRVDEYPARGETRDALDQHLTVWLVQGGFAPVPVPNRLGDELAVHAWLDAMSPCAVILSGGNDLGQAPERDKTETALITYADKKHLPLLGICRGMQMLAQHCGAQLTMVKDHVRVRHELVGSDGVTLPQAVNSFHNWGLKFCPADLAPIATCTDGTVEAFAHSSRPWEGWMWHPEREDPFNPIDMRRFKALVAKATHGA